MESFGFAPVAVITMICFLIGIGWNLSALNNQWIPLICGCAGGLLGLLAFWLAPIIMPAQDPMTAMAIGIASGFAATGLHQTVRQLSQGDGTWNGQL